MQQNTLMPQLTHLDLYQHQNPDGFFSIIIIVIESLNRERES